MSGLNLICKDRMTFGIELPLDRDWSEAGQRLARIEGRPFGVPDTSNPAKRVGLAESLGFDAVWLRDVPVHDPSFGDAGQVFDPFPYLGFLAGRTRRIALGTAGIVLPLRDPILLAKMTASLHHLSGGRFILGIASGDRPVEYPLLGLDYEARGGTLRDRVDQMRTLWSGKTLQGPQGPVTVRPYVPEGIPMVMAGMGQQSLQWIARTLDGWFTYPGPPEQAERRLSMWRQARTDAGLPPAPVLTAMHLDLDPDPDAPSRPIQFGSRIGRNALITHVQSLHAAGVAHIAFNLRQSQREIEDVLAELAEHVMPEFAQENTMEIEQ
ncbi:TIGR03571 family LLM class oxidoreductase [Pseudooceanicola nitratireducens]|uniref:TIGR03571 family LLM class oxidoreductase n=1 Tax=Pseudooceanicola nitratireducens TaxID=517719 RepID=UPI0023F41720|nr:TIGR03571 family LLM class oxidoreductase [Pseudooceanicola nitratireducens]